nr:MAG TPA: hypothetical protein [Bacteriophage sp.]
MIRLCARSKTRLERNFVAKFVAKIVAMDVSKLHKMFQFCSKPLKD